MRKPIINPETLLDLIKQGKSQKEAAAYFGVSPVAISKRLKRLIPPPKSLERLTEKEKKFVITKAKGNTATQAVLESYEVSSLESAKVIGSNLMARPQIQQAICDLMNYHGLTRSFRVGRLKEHVDNRDPNISLKAIDLANKMDGSYIEQRLNVNINPRFEEVDLTPYQMTENKDGGGFQGGYKLTIMKNILHPKR